MNELEILLKKHDWSHAGYASRPIIDQAMRVNIGTEATALWERYCPWSDTNGGYIIWSLK
jgi:hypothetical protein